MVQIIMKIAFKIALVFLFAGFIGGSNVLAQSRAATVREVIPLNSAWEFHYNYDVSQTPKKQTVDLPHTWDAGEVEKGVLNYERGTGIYEKKILVDVNKKDKRLFLYFEGANSVATLFVNNRFVGEHKGGYTAFCFEITRFVKLGAKNHVTIQVSNAYRTDVLPLTGDFNIYGGLHRKVSLLVTSKNCISPLDNASPGVYLVPTNVSSKKAEVNVVTKLSTTYTDSLAIKTTIFDNRHRIATTTTTALTSRDKDGLSQSIIISNPHLWNGKADPYLYKARVQLLYKDKVIDEVVQPLGLRYFSVDAGKGFFLNGKYLDLHGLGLHEDVAGKGSALTSADLYKDMQLIKEVGATALRFTHYPHQQYLYELCDSTGVVVWSEIPFVGPGGYTGAGYIKTPEFHQQAKQVLTEMIRQNFNHPSVCFWGLFNELKLDYDNPVPFLDSLNVIAKTEDPSRITTCASLKDDDTYNGVSDVIAWNKYFGWYGSSFGDLGVWADNTHSRFPQKPFAISEYGAGGSPFQHQENVTQPSPTGRFHPEEWQTLFHEQSWKQLVARPFVWGKYIWVLADFGSSVRTEGMANGINDKGLVTYDRAIKKDAFYFYKANWNPKPMIYIAGRRNADRKETIAQIKGFSNLGKAELFINGISVGTQTNDGLNRMIWERVQLHKGKNIIKMTAKQKGKTVEDTCEWILN